MLKDSSELTATSIINAVPAAFLFVPPWLLHNPPAKAV